MDNKNELCEKRNKEKLSIMRLSLKKDLTEMEEVYRDMIIEFGEIKCISETIDKFSIYEKEFLGNE